MRIDHRTGTVRFGTDLAEAQRQDLPEGPHVQSMPSEQIRNVHLVMMNLVIVFIQELCKIQKDFISNLVVYLVTSFR